MDSRGGSCNNNNNNNNNKNNKNKKGSSNNSRRSSNDVLGPAGDGSREYSDCYSSPADVNEPNQGYYNTNNNDYSKFNSDFRDTPNYSGYGCDFKEHSNSDSYSGSDFSDQLYCRYTSECASPFCRDHSRVGESEGASSSSSPSCSSSHSSPCFGDCRHPNCRAARHLGQDEDFRAEQCNRDYSRQNVHVTAKVLFGSVAAISNLKQKKSGKKK